MTRFLLLLILLFPIATFAQDEELESLVPGEPQTVSIRADLRQSLNFTVEDALYLNIRVESLSEELDPVVWIVDSNDRLMAYNDNVDEQTNSEIDNLYLLAGDYTIFVDSFNGVSEGEIIVSLEMVDPFETESDSSETGITINAFLPEDAVFQYDIPVNIDGVMTVTVRDISASLDPYLAIYDESGTLMTANDDHQSNDLSLDVFDSQVSEWNVSSEGIYTIKIHDFSGKSGQFSLTVTFQP